MKKITVNSLFEIKFLSGASFSPDGKYTAWVESECNKEKNNYRACIFARDNHTGKIKKLTSSGSEYSFLWDADDAILFSAERSDADKPKDDWNEKTAFYRLSLDGGEAEPAFAIDKSVSDIKKVSDGVYAFTSVVDLNKPVEKDEDFGDYHVFEEVPFWGNGRGYVSGKRESLFLYDAVKNEIKKLSADKFQVSGFDILHGRILYYGQEYADVMSIYDEARVCDIETGETKTVVAPGVFSISEARLTESGILAVMSTMDKWGTGQLADFYRMDTDGGNLTLAWHTNGMHIGSDVLGDCAYGGGSQFTVAGDGAYFIGMERYKQEIYFLSADNKVTKLTSFGCNISSIDVREGNIICRADASDGLNELYEVKDGVLSPITNVNAAFLAEHEVSRAEYMPFTDSKGCLVDGWLLKPAGFDPDKKYPAILEIHGGPRCAYTEGFFHEMQALAGNGYFVFFCNPHGSEGYGEEFADLRGKYGTVDYDDLMEFTDFILKNVPEIDPGRLGVGGGSYGGFMCNWIEGHTDRFQAIASQRSISNWVADFGASEIGITFDQNEMGATPWTDMEKMWAQSPLKFADKAKTPILFIHSLCDYNCCIDQGAEMFAAMKYFGVPARMCVFEGENHSLSRTGKPRHRVRRLNEIIGWFDKYLKDNG